MRRDLIEGPEKKKLVIRKSPISWQSLAISAVLGSTLLGYLYYLKEKKDLALHRERRRELGKAKIGGKFELVNTEGKTVKSEDFLGQWIMIYFGFTHCPDVCPDEIEKMVGTINKLGNYSNGNCPSILISKLQFLISFLQRKRAILRYNQFS